MNAQVFDMLQSKGLARGFVVRSLAGHDWQKPYIVIKVEKSFVYLADGRLRRLEKPKKKKARHVQPIGMLREPGELDIIESSGDWGCRNSKLRRLLNEFLDDHMEKEES